MARFDSYQSPLRLILNNIAVRVKAPVFVEYGPGGSTIFMKDLVRNARIVSVEHQERWYNHYQKLFEESEYKNVSIHLRSLRNGYVKAPIPYVSENSADLIYVDGRKRAQCLRLARRLMKPESGIVVLHDAERIYYWLGYRLWRRSHRRWFGSSLDRTLVLFPRSFSQKDIDSILKRI